MTIRGNWRWREPVGKGVMLGLAVHAVLAATTWPAVQTLAGWLAAAVVVTLIACKQFARRTATASNPQAPLWAGWLLLFLEHPVPIHAALTVGLVGGSLAAGWSWLATLVYAAVGGLIGLSLHLAGGIRRRLIRQGLSVLVIAAAFAATWAAATYSPFGEAVLPGGPVTAVTLALMALTYYLAMLAARSEETEAEVALICVGLAAGLAQLQLPFYLRGLVLIIPAALFVLYSERVLRGIVVFKHVIRGMGFEQRGQLGEALLEYQSALRREPTSKLARAGSARTHRRINPAELVADNQLWALVDTRLCLERVDQILARKRPSASELDEAATLLSVVARRRQDLPFILAFRMLQLAVHRNDPEAALVAASPALQLPAPAIAALADHEADAFFRLWSAVLQEKTLVAAGGPKVLQDRDGALRFLACLARRHRQAPNDPVAAQFRPFALERLTWDAYRDYRADHPEDDLAWLDYREICRLGEALAESGAEADEIDDARRRRACDLLTIAQAGLQAGRLHVWGLLARLAPDVAAERRWLEQLRDAGQAVAPSTLDPTDRKAYFRAVHRLAALAEEAGDTEEAIRHLRLYMHAPTAGLGTLDRLRDLLESAGDLLDALEPVEAGLAYSLSDSQREIWMAHKHRLYAAVPVATVTANLTRIERWFDFTYCYKTAARLFDEKAATAEVFHYLDLATLGGAAALPKVNYLLGRNHQRAGDPDAAVACFEQVIAKEPDRWGDEDSRDCYYRACRLLGDLYLDDRPNPPRAIEVLRIYERSSKSGADTLYKLGRAYEAHGDARQAKKWYDMVLVYSGHPLADAARTALSRLTQTAGGS